MKDTTTKSNEPRTRQFANHYRCYVAHTKNLTGKCKHPSCDERWQARLARNTAKKPVTSTAQAVVESQTKPAAIAEVKPAASKAPAPKKPAAAKKPASASRKPARKKSK